MLPERRDQVAYLIYRSLNNADCSSCDYFVKKKPTDIIGEDPCTYCTKRTNHWALNKATANRIANDIEAIVENTPSVRKTTFGQILDLMDKDRESEEEVRLMNGTEVSIYGPMNSPFWKPFEDRAVNNWAIEDGALEVWFEED